MHDAVVGGGTKGNLERVNGLEALADLYGYADPADIHNLTSLREGEDPGEQHPTAELPIAYTNDRVDLETLGQTQWDFQYPSATERTVVRTIAGGFVSQATTTYTFDTAGLLSQKIDAASNKLEYVRTATQPTPTSTRSAPREATAPAATRSCARSARAMPATT